MPRDESAQVPPQHSPPGDPRQFGLIDLFALLTLAALVSAMAAPLVRHAQTLNREVLLLVIGFQVLVAAGAVIFAAGHRRGLLAIAGRRIAIVYSGQLNWRHWPLVKSMITMTALAAAQLGMALLLAFFATDSKQSPNIVVWLYYIQLACVTGYAFSRFLWRVYPNAIEFFEGGISADAVTLVPWEWAEVRPSRFHQDPVVVVVRPMPGSAGGITRTAQLPRGQRDAVLAALSQASARHRTIAPETP
jgi:hypothetical protein